MEDKPIKPIMSVIIAAYNYGVYLDDAIISVLQQTLPTGTYEIIVIDDGSTDDTRERMTKYLSEVIYHYKDNGGQASAFNMGIALARGEFVAFLDADDYWHPEKLALVLERFQSNTRVDVVYHTLQLVDNADQQRGVYPPWFGKVLPENPIENYKHWMTVIGSATSGIAWRMSALLSLCPVPEEYRICADGYLMFGAPLVAREFGLIDKPLGFYRIHSENNYATFGLSDGSTQVKSQDIGSHYHRMFLQHLRGLAEKFDCQDCGMIWELTGVCFKDELLAIREKSGIISALLAFWKGRRQISNLSHKHRLFRVTIIILQLFLPGGVFRELRLLYTNSPLWLFVQRYVKNDTNFVETTQAAEHL